MKLVDATETHKSIAVLPTRPPAGAGRVLLPTNVGSNTPISVQPPQEVVMYAKVFHQIFDSSIADDYKLRHFFMDLLVLADQNGVVDMTQAAISARTRIPLQEVIEHLQRLEQPDPESRTPHHGGRRILRLDKHRSWGWCIINYDTFRKMASEEQRREKNLARVKKYREKLASHATVTPCNAPVTDVHSCHPKQKQRQIQKHKGTCTGSTTAGKRKSASEYLPTSEEVEAYEQECEFWESVSAEAQAETQSIFNIQGSDPKQNDDIAAQIYAAYPLKSGEAKAIAAIKRQLVIYGFDKLMAATLEFAKCYVGATDERFRYCWSPAKFFDDLHFKDDPKTWKLNATDSKSGKPNPRNIGFDPKEAELSSKRRQNAIAFENGKPIPFPEVRLKLG